MRWGGSNWTEERLARLKGLSEQQWSASQIAADLGVTKNAVIGKAARMGYSLNGSKPRAPALRRRKTHQRPFVLDRARFQKDIAEPPKLPPAPQLVVHGAVQLIELEHHHCRWPVDVPGKPMMYCGAQRWDDETPYCPHHHVIGHDRVTRHSRRL